MSRLVSRILLSIFMFPLAVLFYGFVAAALEQMLRGPSYRNEDIVVFLISSILTWAAVAGYWILLWWTGVNWTPTRIGGSVVAAALAAVAGGAAGMLASSLLDIHDTSFGVFLAGILAILLWLIATVLLWRESPAERAARFKGSNRSAITCPTCGYNLTGLSQSRCPECGSTFTLDQLLALQPGADKEID
ncbi:MAG TPA: hypothetical protein VHY37_06090 [Tepidisphaeraceae bacterium]|nr:hypothetical protein [Tepidisphaeraceae bacterium]